MSRPDPDDLNYILDQCLLQLQAGAELDAVLEKYPELSRELRSILEAVAAVMSARGSDTVPIAAMRRSRASLLSATHQINILPRPQWWEVQWTLFTGGLRQTRAMIIPLTGLVLIVSLLFTGLASAQALPGETLYPVKIAAEQIGLSLSGSSSDRLQREENYDLRRKEEVEVLITKKREEEVHLTGFLSRRISAGWWIDEIKLSMPAELAQSAEGLENRYVSVSANLQPQGELIVKRIEPRIYQISGRISAKENSRVMVGDVWVQINNDTQQLESIELGQTVRVSVTRLQSGALVGLKIEGIEQIPLPSKAVSPTYQPSETREPNKGEDYTPAKPPNETVEPGKTEQPNDKNETLPEKTISSDGLGEDKLKQETPPANDDNHHEAESSQTPEKGHD